MTRIIPVKVIAVDEADDVLFTMEAFDEIAVSIEFKTLLSNSNIIEVTEAMIAALALMQLDK